MLVLLSFSHSLLYRARLYHRLDHVIIESALSPKPLSFCFFLQGGGDLDRQFHNSIVPNIILIVLFLHIICNRWPIKSRKKTSSQHSLWWVFSDLLTSLSTLCCSKETMLLARYHLPPFLEENGPIIWKRETILTSLLLGYSYNKLVAKVSRFLLSAERRGRG